VIDREGNIFGIFVAEVDTRVLSAVGPSFYSFSLFGLVRVRWAAYQLWNHDWPTVCGLSRRNTDGRRGEDREGERCWVVCGTYDHYDDQKYEVWRGN